MTLWASRDEHDPSIVAVQCTYGPVTFKVTEHESHVGSFWSELGRLLAQNRQHVEAQARAGYERYREHANGVSVNGDALPAWEDLAVTKEGADVQEHWAAVFGG